MTKDLNRIARDIEYLIAREVEKKSEIYAKKAEKYFDLKSQIEDLAHEGELLYANYKAEGLSAGMIEAEGFLRCAKTLLNRVKDLED